jgi:XTP/dITP diphosphohydrolase
LKVVVASRNRGKLREIVPLLAELDLDLVTIDDLAPDCELREDGATFEDNAFAKARQAAAATGLPAIADDSGLEVDALDGAPGVYSARYAGLPDNLSGTLEGPPPATGVGERSSPASDAIDARNNAKLLEALRDVAPPGRRARFRCVAAFVDPAAGLELARSGDCEGEILEEGRGDLGFGYDPLFLVPALGRTMAELPLAEKNRLSHRAAAFRALADALRVQRSSK